MSLLPSDQRLLHQSLELAEDAAAFASPNPTVGCVLAREGVALGGGAHRYDLRDHAEIVALKAAAAAGHDVRGATAYVTLEPCSHHGRTGPCADALVAGGIQRCLVATIDPNPLVGGRGLARLRAADVSVDLLDPKSPEAGRARRLNDAFAFSVRHGRPFVTLKIAVSQDGRIAPPSARRVAATPFWLTGTAARADVQRQRHLADAILTGIGTVLADDPSLTDRTGLPRRKPLVRVVLDSDLRMPLDAKLVQSAQEDLLLFASQEAPRQREGELQARGVEVVRLPSRGGRLDLQYVLAALAPYPNLLVEAGSALNAALVEGDLVDKLVVYTAPVVLRDGALPCGQGIPLETLRSRLTSITERRFANGEAEDHCLSGYLHDPWADLSVDGRD